MFDRDSELIFEAYLARPITQKQGLKKGSKVRILNTPWLKDAFPDDAGKEGEIVSGASMDNGKNYLIKLKGIDEPGWWFVNDFQVLN